MINFRYISIEEMKNGIFKGKDFPITFGLPSNFLLDKKNHYGLFLDNKLIGISQVRFTKGTMRIRAIEIKKNYQSRGYGSLFLSELEKLAKSKDCSEINLCPRDYRVYDFYKKNGYKLINEHLMRKEI